MIVQTAILFHDADRQYLRILEKHLKPLCNQKLMQIWHRDKILAGEEADALIRDRLNTSHLILLLVSADFNAECEEQITTALRSSEGTATEIVPIILRQCAWTSLPFYGLQPIPRDCKPLVTSSKRNDARFFHAAEEIRHVVARIRSATPSEMSAVTVLYPAVIQTLAQLERERFALECKHVDARTDVPPAPRSDDLQHRYTDHVPKQQHQSPASPSTRPEGEPRKSHSLYKYLVIVVVVSGAIAATTQLFPMPDFGNIPPQTPSVLTSAISPLPPSASIAPLPTQTMDSMRQPETRYVWAACDASCKPKQEQDTVHLKRGTPIFETEKGQTSSEALLDDGYFAVVHMSGDHGKVYRVQIALTQPLHQERANE